MAFAQRFNEVTSDITHISDLEDSRRYPIERADRVTTRFGDTFLLSIRDTADNRLCKVFFPRYSTAFKDKDLRAINERTTASWGIGWCLLSKEKCPTTNAYQLVVEAVE